MALTVHTSRTLMLEELSRVMEHGSLMGNFDEILSDNVTGKLSKSNQLKTNRYLRQLYGFDKTDPGFASFLWFWKNAPSSDRPVVSLIYAIRNDYLLSESISVMEQVSLDKKASIEMFSATVEQLHPNHYSPTTLLSLSQNLASSWKQAGFIEGKVKNIRKQPGMTYWAITFAILLGYLDGLRGEFLLGSRYIRALGLPQKMIRDLITEAAKRDLLQYQYSGGVTTILTGNLIKRIGLHGF